MEFEEEPTYQRSNPAHEIAEVGIGLGLVFESPMIVSEVASTLGTRLGSSIDGPLAELTGNALGAAYQLAPLVGIMAIMATGFRMMLGGKKGNTTEDL